MLKDKDNFYIVLSEFIHFKNKSTKLVFSYLSKNCNSKFTIIFLFLIYFDFEIFQDVSDEFFKQELKKEGLSFRLIEPVYQVYRSVICLSLSTQLDLDHVSFERK